jgi:hypothetical protein
MKADELVDEESFFKNVDLSVMTNDDIFIFSMLSLCSPQLEQQIFNKIIEKDYSSAYLDAGKPYLIDVLKKTFNKVPDEYKYQVFIEAYSYVEYGFSSFTHKITDAVRQLRPIETNNLLISKADHDGKLTIYRGESLESSNIKKVLSWTLDHDKAIWFAKRMNFSGVGYVYTAKVKPLKVIAYLDSREESEVLVRYKDLNLIFKEVIQIPNRTAEIK